MKTAIATVKFTGKGPLSFGKYIQTPKGDKESYDAFDERTWKERMHYNENGEIFVSEMMIKNMLSEAAKFRGEQIKGKGKSTYTKHFEAGIFVNTPMMLGINKDNVECEIIVVPSDGKRGGTSRVPKRFPKILTWEGKAVISVLDETITKDVLERHLTDAGNFIGLGRFRPRQNGLYGRFNAEILSWE